MQEENVDEESEDEEDFSLFVKKFHKFVKKRRIERHQNFNHGKRFQEDSPTLRCYKCNQLGHIKANCPSNEQWLEKNEKKSHEERRSKKAYIAWDDKRKKLVHIYVNKRFFVIIVVVVMKEILNKNGKI